MNLFDFGVYRQLQSEIDMNRSRGHRTDTRTVELEARVRVLEMHCAALWSLLKAEMNWTDEELIEAAKAADPVRGPDHCPRCGRKLLVKGGVNCSWCGHRLAESPTILGADAGTQPDVQTSDSEPE